MKVGKSFFLNEQASHHCLFKFTRIKVCAREAGCEVVGICGMMNTAEYASQHSRTCGLPTFASAQKG